MYVMVVGCGRVGAELSLMLAGQGHDVVIIDKDPDSFRRLGPVFNGITITGIGFDEKILTMAGIEHANAFVAVTEYDNTNLMAAEVADKIFKVPKVIARLYNPHRESTYQKLGVDYVCGTTLLAGRIFETLVHPFTALHHRLDDETKIVEFPATEKWVGKKLSELRLPKDLLIIALKDQDNKSVVASPELKVKAEDTLIAIAKDHALNEISFLWEPKAG